jgi:hypothetical protein
MPASSGRWFDVCESFSLKKLTRFEKFMIPMGEDAMAVFFPCKYLTAGVTRLQIPQQLAVVYVTCM